MRVFRLGLIVAVVILISFGCACEGSQRTKPLTWDDAITRARQFCKAVGWSEQGTQVIDRKFQRHPDRWDVSFISGGAQKRIEMAVDMDKRTGRVTFAMNHAKEEEQRRQHGAACSESRFNSNARKYLKLAGVNRAGMVRSSRKDGFPEPWVLGWHREYKGYRFLSYEVMWIALNPHDASLVHLQAPPMSSPSPPSTVQVSINRAKAKRLGIKHLSRQGHHPVVEGAQLEIVPEKPEPSYRLMMAHRRSAKMRLAWVISLAWEGEYSGDVAVDAKDGRILWESTCK